MTPASLNDSPRGEAWAQAQLDKGLPVSFPAEWPPEDRGLGGAFVADALRHRNESPAPPLFSIENAVITTALTLHAAPIDSEVCFERCAFAAAASFRDVAFAHRVRFAECVFEDALALEACRIRELWFVADLDLAATADRPGTIVRGPFSVMNSAVAGDLICDGARFEHASIASFNSLAVEGSLLLRNAAFSGGVDLTAFKAGISLDAANATFLHPDLGVGLTSARIAGYANFQNARFHGPFDFSAAQVTGSCSFGGATFARPSTFIALSCGSARFDQARFTDQTGGADFNSASISGHLSFKATEFGGPATFTSLTVGGILDCSNATFAAPEAAATFDSATVSGHALFVETTFHGFVEFGLANVTGIMSFMSAKFLNPSRGVSFHAMHAQKVMVLAGAVFHGPVVMRAIKVGGDLHCGGTAFLGEAHTLTLDRAHIAGSLDFSRATCEGLAQFTSVRVAGHAIFNEARFDKAADFNSARLEGLAVFNDTTFGGPAGFRFIHVGQSTEFALATFKDTFELASAHLEGDLLFSTGPAAPSAPGTVCEGEADFRASRLDKGARFEDAAFRKGAFFDQTAIGGDAQFLRAHFGGDASFSAANFKSSAYFNGAVFGGASTFERCTIGGELHFLRPSGGERPRGTVFAGSVNADTLTVAGTLLFEHARFAPGAGLTLRGARAGFLSVLDTRFSDVTLFSAQSALAIVFQDTTVRNNLDLSNTKVGGPVRFRGVRVRGRVKLSHADVSGSVSIGRYHPGGDKPALPCVFKGPADFSYSRFQSNTHVGEEIAGGAKDDLSVQFGADATFAHCTFGGEVLVQYTRFEGSASFSKARFLNRLGLLRAEFRNKGEGSAVFAEAEFHGQVVMKTTTVAGRLALYGARAHHNLLIDSSCRFEQRFDCRGASLASLQIRHDADLPLLDLPFLGTLDMDGCQYQRIECDLGLKAFWTQLSRSAKQVAEAIMPAGVNATQSFTKQPYLQFEQFCRASGENGLADRVYMRARLREGLRHWPKRPGRLAWNLFQLAIFGYGVVPILMVVWFLVFLIAGANLLETYTPDMTRLRALAVSFTNLVPGAAYLIEDLQPSPSRLTVSVGFAQHAIGLVLLALIAERIFKGLKR